MSLIDEALKRARQEAARQDEAARELRYKQVPVIPGLRKPARRSWVLPAIIAACLGVGVGLGLSFVRGGGEDQRAAVPPSVSAPAAAPAPVRVAQAPAAPAPAVLEEAEPPATEEKKPEKPAPAAAVPPAVPAQERAPAREEAPVIAEMRQREIALNPAPRPRSAPPETRESEPAAPAPPPSAHMAPAPAPSAPEPAAPAAAAADPGQVRTYQQELPLAGGGTLRLNGIAFSDQPVALFGGKVVGLGESVAGYKVVAIEARRVRLEGAGGVVVVEMP